MQKGLSENVSKASWPKPIKIYKLSLSMMAQLIPVFKFVQSTRVLIRGSCCLMARIKVFLKREIEGWTMLKVPIGVLWIQMIG